MQRDFAQQALHPLPHQGVWLSHAAAASKSQGMEVWATDDVAVGGCVLFECFDGSLYTKPANFDMGKVLQMSGVEDADILHVEYMERDMLVLLHAKAYVSVHTIFLQA